MIVNSIQEDIIDNLLLETGGLLREFAQSNDFISILETSFGTDYSTTAVEALQTALLRNEFLEHIKIEVLPSDQLQGALGAYDTANNSIYLSQELIANASFDQAVGVLLEEVGHAIDAKLNATDAPGDEGAIFSELVRGQNLTETQLQALSTEDDTATITLEREEIAVERSQFIVDFIVDDDGNGNSTTISDAINSAQAGDIIFVTGGADNIHTEANIIINKSVTIIGNIPFVAGDSNVTINANNNGRVFNINDRASFSTLNVTLDGLTITGGNAGLLDIAPVGGGILNAENLTLIRSTVSGNSAISGGGIWNIGTVVLNNSTVSGNSATDEGGGIWHSSGTGTVALNNSTVSGNSATFGGGIFHDNGYATLNNSTVSENSSNFGGGIWNEGILSITNSIVANSSGSFDLENGSPDNRFAVVAVNARNSLIESYDVINGTNFNNILGEDPLLSPLQDNGGPTLTHALLQGSPAINAGNDNLIPEDTLDLDSDNNTIEDIPFDQRGTGFDRIVGDTVDIGAFESFKINFTKTQDSGNEGQSLELELQLDRAPQRDLTVNYTIESETGASPSDYTIPDSIIIPAGENSATIPVTLNNDDIDELDESFKITLLSSTELSSTEYIVGTKKDTTVTINDDDDAGITVTLPGDTTTTEFGEVTGLYQFQLNSQPTADVTLNFTLDETEGDISELRTSNRFGDPISIVIPTTSLTFTPAKWSEVRTIQVTGLDDAIDDGDITDLIKVAVSSDDNFYNNSLQFKDPKGNPLTDISYTNEDDDTAGVTITVLDNKTSEFGETAQYQFQLNSQPTATVTINLTNLDTSEGDLSIEGDLPPSFLTFDSTDWSLPKTITVTGKNDDVDDGDIEDFINIGITSDDGKYGGNTPLQDPDGNPVTNISYTNEDNDTAGIIIEAVDTTTTELEETAQYDIKLTSQPTANVTLTFSQTDDSEGTLDKSELMFTPANWDAFQTIIVTGQDDDIKIKDGNITRTVNIAVNSQDSNFNGLSGFNFSYTNEDNDTAEIDIDSVDKTTTESGETAEYRFKLTSQPTAEVTLTFSGVDSSEGSLLLSSLTFTDENWDDFQTLTVTGVDDDSIDDDQTYDVKIDVTSSDLNYDGQNASFTVTNHDKDQAGITLSQRTFLETTEEEGSDTFTVTLNTQPNNSVTLEINGLNAEEGELSPNSLTFDSNDWDKPQTVTVTGLDDLVDDDDQFYTLTFDASNSADSDFQKADLSSQTISVTNSDNDTAEISITPTSGQTSEDGASVTFDVFLGSQPTSDVEVVVSSEDETEGTVDVTSLTFTPDNFSTSQTVMVTGQDDLELDSDRAYTVNLQSQIPSGGDSKYQGLSSSFSVTNIDNDQVPVASINANTADVTEGELGGFTIFLDHPALQGGATIAYTVSGSATDGEDYNQLLVQTVKVAAGETEAQLTLQTLDDFIAEDAETITITLVSSNDNEYLPSSSQGTASLSLTDNDEAGIAIAPKTAETDENGGSASLEVVLTSQPTAEVTVNFSTSDSSEGNLSASAVTFTPDNWNQSQSVTVTGVDDPDEDGKQFYQVQGIATSSDGKYEGLISNPVQLTNLDNDGFAVLIATSGGDLSVTEGGESDTYEIALSKAPTSPVEITATADSQTEISLDGVNFASSQTVFLSDTTPKIVTVRALDDSAIEATHSSAIVHQISNSSDPNYPTTLPLSTITATVQDNDLSGVSIASTNPASEESTVPGQFNLLLSEVAPAGGLTVQYQVLDSTTATASNESGNPDYFALSGEVFIPEGETGGIISITPTPDDLISEPEETVTIELTPTENYTVDAGKASGSVVISDDDIAGVRLIESGSLTQGLEGKSDDYAIRLTSEPRENVTIAFNTESNVAAIAPLTFTPDNWDTPQTVKVNFLDDNQANGDRETTISHTATSADSDYNGISVQDITATILDNEVPGVTFSSTNVLTEGEENVVAYTAVLDTQPTAPVTLSFVPDGNFKAIAPLTFTSQNWNQPQAVLVTPVDDNRAGLDQQGTILHTLNSTDANFNNLSLPNQTVSILEDDTVGVNVTPGDNQVREDGQGDQLDIVLNSQPFSNVTIDFFPNSDLQGIDPLIFTPDNWNQSQTVTVNATEDNLNQGNVRNAAIEVEVSSTDAPYNSIEIADLNYSIGDIAAITLSEKQLQVGTGGRTDSFTVVLDSQPFAEVTVNFDFDNSLLQPIDSLSFTPDNWETPQTVTVAAIEEAVSGGIINTTLTPTLTSTDPDYDSLDADPIPTNILNEGAFGSWAAFVDGLLAEGLVLAEGGALLQSFLETEVGELLLPIQLEKITEDAVIARYEGEVNTNELLSTNPDLTAIAQALEITNLFPTVSNPKIEISNVTTSSPAIEPILTAINASDIIDLFTNVDLASEVNSLFPNGINFDLQLSSDQVEVIYGDNISITDLLSDIPGVNDLVSTLDPFPSLAASEPSLTVINPATEPSFEFNAGIPLIDLQDWLLDKVTPLIPDNFGTAIESLLGQIGMLEVGFSEDRLSVTLDGDLDLASLLNDLALAVGFSDQLFASNTSFPVANPSFTVINPGTSNSSFEFEVTSLPVAELQTWLEARIQEQLGDFGLADEASDLLSVAKDIDLTFGDSEIAIAYGGSFNLTTIINSLAGTVGLSDILTVDLEVLNPSLTLINPGTEEASYEFAADELPVEALLTWLQEELLDLVSLPNSLKDSLALSASIARNFSLLLTDTGINVVYAGDIDVLGIVNSLTNSLGLGQPFDSSLIISNPELEIQKDEESGYDFLFTIPRLAKSDFIDLLNELNAPDFITDILAGLSDLELVFGNDLFELTALEDINLTPIINGLGLGTISTALPVSDLVIRVEGSGQDRTFEVEVGALPFDELTTLLTDLLGNSLPDPIQTSLNSIGDTLGNLSFVISSEQVTIRTEDSSVLSLDLAQLFEGSPIPVIQDVVEAVLVVVTGKPALEFEIANAEFSVTAGQEVALVAEFNERTLEATFQNNVPNNDFDLIYQLGDTLDLSTVAEGIPFVEDFSLSNAELIVSSRTEQIDDPDLGLVTLVKGFNFKGFVDFVEIAESNSNNDPFDFITKNLGIENIGVLFGLSSTEISIGAVLAGKIPLIKIDGFVAELNNIKLDLAVSGAPPEPTFSVGGTIALSGYDPFQSNEPKLFLVGELILEADSASGAFALQTDGTGWTNPFGIPDTEIRNLAFQIGATYQPPFVDNFAFLGDVLFGNLDIKGAFSIDINDPDNIAIALTPNAPLRLINLLGGVIGQFVLKQVGNNVKPVQDLLDLLDTILDGEIAAINSDGDDELDPLIQFVPFLTEIAGISLEPGYGINGTVDIYGAKATLAINASPSLTNLQGSLEVQEIDLGGVGIIEIRGVDDLETTEVDESDALNLDIVVDGLNSSISGDVAVTIAGYDILEANFSVNKEAILLTGMLDIPNIIELNINLEADRQAGLNVEGSGSLVLFDQFDLVQADLELGSEGLFVEGAIDLLGIVGAELELEVLSNGELSFFANTRANLFGSIAEVTINGGFANGQGNLSLGAGLDFNVGPLGLKGSLNSNITAGTQGIGISLSGQGEAFLFGYELGSQSFSFESDVLNELNFKTDLDLGPFSFDAKVLVTGDDIDINASGRISLFGINIAQVSASIQTLDPGESITSGGQTFTANFGEKALGFSLSSSLDAGFIDADFDLAGLVSNSRFKIAGGIDLDLDVEFTIPIPDIHIPEKTILGITTPAITIEIPDINVDLNLNLGEAEAAFFIDRNSGEVGLNLDVAPFSFGIKGVNFSFDPTLNLDFNTDDSFTTILTEIGDDLLDTIKDKVLDFDFGSLLNGYVQGGTVWLDSDLDGLVDANEPTTQTDSRGSYQLNLPDELDPSSGLVRVKGGIDTATDQPFVGTQTSVLNSVISPLTTLLIELAQESDFASAQTQVRNAFGIDASVDLLTFDHTEQTLQGNPQAQAVILAVATVQGVVINVQNLIAGATGGTLSELSEIDRAALNQGTYSAIAQSLTKDNFDLTNPDQIKTIIQNAVTEAQNQSSTLIINSTRLNDVIDEAAEVIVAGVSKKQLLSEKATTGLEAFTRISQAKLFGSTEEAEALNQLGQGNLEPEDQTLTELSDTSDTALETIRSLTLPPQVDRIDDFILTERFPSVDEFPFKLYDAETPSNELTLDLASNNPELIPISAITIVPSENPTEFLLSIGAIAPEKAGSATLTLTVTDGDGNTVEREFTVTVEVDNAPSFEPVETVSVPRSAASGTKIVDLDATNGDGGAVDADINYSLVGGNDNRDGDRAFPFQIDSQTGEIFLNDEGDFEEEFGTEPFELTIEADDGFKTSEVTLIVEITENTPPVLENPINDLSTSENEAFTFAVPENVFKDSDLGDRLTYQANLSNNTWLPSWLSFDSETRTFSGTPLNEDIGAIELEVTATDREGESASDTFTLTVANTTDPPTDINITNVIVNENAPDGTLIANISATDPDPNDTITFTLLDNAEGRFTLVEDQLFVQDASLIDFESQTSHNIRIEAKDSTGLTTEQLFTLQVQDDIDDITGGGENETILVGDGGVTLTGNGGSDTFVYTHPNQGGSIITDFNAENDDLIDVSTLLSDNRSDLVSFGVSNVYTNASPFDAYLSLESVGNDTLVKYAPYGEFAPSFFQSLVTLENVPTAEVDANDFIFS